MGQFRALSVKNWILFKRSIIGSALEILLPIIFSMFFILVRNLAEIKTYQEQQYLTNQNYTFTYYGNPHITSSTLGLNFYPFLKQCNGSNVIALVPAGDPLVAKMNTIFTSPSAGGRTVQEFSSDDAVDAYVRNSGYGVDIPYICFGLSFQNVGASYKYNLRFNISNYDLPSPSEDLTTKSKFNPEQYQGTVFSGVVSVANIVNSAILQTEVSSTTMLLHTQGPIYQSTYISDPIYIYLGNSLQFLLLLPLLIVYLRQTSSMLTEKQTKIRQSMSITGMKIHIYYLTWFIRYFVIYAIIHAVISAIISQVFPYVPYYIPLIIFILFDVVLIIQSFFIQIFVTRAKIGIVFALLFFVLQYVINYLVVNNSNPTINIYRLVSIVPHVAYIQAMKMILYCVSVQTVVNFTQVVNYYSIITAIVSLCVNIVFWGIVMWYLDQIFPNQWGAKKHPCFCCVSNRDRNEQVHPEVNKNQKMSSSMMDTVQKIKQQRDPQIESVQGKYKEMEQNSKAIIIKNLNKVFAETNAVKNLSMSMYTDQIFVLLGHNGAGKTTTISMLTGMIQPTSGLIQVLGATQLSEIRSKIGVCPQHDTLYEDLTVQQHIRLFATFRGLEDNQLDLQVQKLIKDVNLQEKKNQYSKNLSGGQKRRLSVAMAFAGGAKVIILDQPTSGMDTSARRYIWQMLKNYKNDRIILLTTHFMDEADYLGDRIAIMAGGKLVALGSNVYLKNKFGVGYNLTFSKKGIEVSSKPIIDCVARYVNTATVLSNVSSQVAIQLPLDKVSYFPQMFNQIDSKKKQLGYQSYGISITTLEQVFLKVGEEAEEKKVNKEKEQKDEEKQLQNSTITLKSPKKIQKSQQLEVLNLQKVHPKNIPKKVSLPQIEKEKVNQDENQQQNWTREDGCCQRFFSHFLATILKRLRVIRRDLKSFIFQLLLPMLIIILALMLMRISFVADYASQELTYKTYLKQTSPVYVPISSASADSALLSSLQNKITLARGSDISIHQHLANTALQFDKDFLYGKKSEIQTLKAGIYFQPTYVQTGITIVPFTTIINTRSPTSVVASQTLAAQAYINQLGSRPITITSISKPLPRTFKQLKTNNIISGFFAAMIFSIALSFKFASIVSFIVKQRQDRSKHQQIVSGMNVASYWFGNFVYDYLLYVIVAVFSIVMCKVLSVDSLITGYAFTATCLLFFLYGLANIPLTYILGYIFKDYGNAQGAVYFFDFVSGGIVTIIILVLRWIDEGSNKIGRGLAWPLRMIPSFAFGQGLINIGSISTFATFQNNGVDLEIFALQVALAPIFFLGIFGCLYITILFVLEWLQNNERFMRCFTSQTQNQQTNLVQDSDVIQQQKKALSANPNDYQIITKALRKVYIVDSQKKHKIAVDNLSFTVDKGEVFGLLGVNGAGKTTTFKILAGQIVSSSGESFFSGLRISQNLSTVRKNLGYCPQFDALIQNLTVKEQLQLFYDMKCLPKRYKQKAIKQKIKQMNLQQYEDKLSGTLSGGNKRKLSVAMAMIGNPSILFLDQPSTGMDPKARRFMWKVISRISTERKQSTVILTTHSMQQAEALSTRLGIMVNGNFKCIGTPQHIKSKYGKGFQIEVKIKNIKKDIIDEIRKNQKIDTVTILKGQLDSLLTRLKVNNKTRGQINKQGTGNYIWQQLEAGKKCSVNSIIEFNVVEKKVQAIEQTLRKAISEIQIIEHLQTFVRFKTGSNVSVGKLFSLLESKKVELSIMQYSIKQATVEQIFNKFAEQEGNNRRE